MIDKKWLEEIEYRLEKHPEDYYSPSVVKKLIDAYRNKNHEPIADYDILAYDTVEITKDDFYWIIGKVYEEAEDLLSHQGPQIRSERFIELQVKDLANKFNWKTVKD